VRIHRHRYRGETWYILQDRSRTRFHRFTPSAHELIGQMDGQSTVDEIWEAALESLGDEAPTQEEMIRLLAQLHMADALLADVPPDVRELFERGERLERRMRAGRWLSPFAIRIPLFDPERFLDRTLPLVRPLFGWLGAALWLVVVGTAIVATAIHWSELTGNFLDRVFTASNLLVLWLVFPFVKMLHEFGHAYATKVHGGEVHDVGIMLLVFTPVPYVDASTSWALPSKRHRALIGAGGMVVEVFVAAVALHLWVAMEPGVARSVAYNAALLGGLTTLIFNANPLLRFDGYYILSDLAEIPNLRTRSNRAVAWLFQRYAFGLRDEPPPDHAPGESRWLVGYAILAFLYRLTVVIAIGLWILGQFFLVGLVLGIFAVVGWIVLPLVKGLRQLLTSPRIATVRGRAYGVVGAGAAAVVLLLAVIPAPLRTRAEGVVWVPEHAFVRAGIDGFMHRISTPPGSDVGTGDLLFELRDAELTAEVEVLSARVRELEAVRDAVLGSDPVALVVNEGALALARSLLADAHRRAGELAVRSRTSGTFVVVRPDDLTGRFVRKGELLGYVVELDRLTVRAVVPQDDIDLVRRRTRGVEIRPAERAGQTLPAELRLIAPAASVWLPSRALGSAGGGEVPMDPMDAAGSRAVQSLFEAELEAENRAGVVTAGGRVWVRFDHGTEPLGVQWARRLRQLFLKRFHV
jgi:putative peptide zinc metalloprotease protein